MSEGEDLSDNEEEYEEEYDCPIHGKCNGIDECPLCP
jgi:hypothetical protein